MMRGVLAFSCDGFNSSKTVSHLFILYLRWFFYGPIDLDVNSDDVRNIAALGV